MKPFFDKLPETITAPRTDAVYNCHAYLTKVPVKAIRPFIETFTARNDTVVDFFAGSGMTGLAARMNGRRAVLSDISALGQHITHGYLAEVSPSVFRTAANSVMAAARDAIGDLYTTTREEDGVQTEMVRTVWSFTYICPSCFAPIIYFNHLSPKGVPCTTCPSCGGPFVRRNWPRGEDMPVEVVVDGMDGKQTTQAVSELDLCAIKAASADSRQKNVPSLVIDEHREMYSRSGLGKAGMTETARFFSPRNAIALLELWQAINKVDDEQIHQKLRFAFTAILPRASRRYQWSAKRPLNAQNQTYYIAPVYYEWNVFALFGRKVEAALRADKFIFDDSIAPSFDNKYTNNVTYELASADRLSHIKSSSVDYVFTDPPFGSNIFYSDMSLFHEAWLGTVTDNTREAVIHTTGRRKNSSAERYKKLLQGAFSEAYRILKPGKYMSVVFGNSSGQIWGLVQCSLRNAGFNVAPVHVAILDKGQRSVKGLNSGSEGVVTVDLILTVKKPTQLEPAEDIRELSNGDTERLIAEAVEELSIEGTKSPSHVYARVLRKAIQHHFALNDLHLGDVLIALRNAGFTVNRKTGRFVTPEDVSAAA